MNRVESLVTLLQRLDDLHGLGLPLYCLHHFLHRQLLRVYLPHLLLLIPLHLHAKHRAVLLARLVQCHRLFEQLRRVRLHSFLILLQAVARRLQI